MAKESEKGFIPWTRKWAGRFSKGGMIVGGAGIAASIAAPPLAPVLLPASETIFVASAVDTAIGNDAAESLMRTGADILNPKRNDNRIGSSPVSNNEFKNYSSRKKWRQVFRGQPRQMQQASAY